MSRHSVIACARASLCKFESTESISFMGQPADERTSMSRGSFASFPCWQRRRAFVVRSSSGVRGAHLPTLTSTSHTKTIHVLFAHSFETIRPFVSVAVVICEQCVRLDEFHCKSLNSRTAAPSTNHKTINRPNCKSLLLLCTRPKQQ